MTAKTEIAGSCCILFGDGHTGMEQRVSSGLGHDGGFPAIDRSIVEGGVTQITGTSRDDRFDDGVGLSAWLCPIQESGRER